MRPNLLYSLALALICSQVFSQTSYLEIKQEEIKQGDKISLAYITDQALTPDTWIGMYKEGASSANTSDGRISYGYVKDAESFTQDWTGPPLPGRYEFRLISQKELLFTLPFEVIPIDEREVQLILQTDRILPEQSFEFQIETSLTLNRNSRLGTYSYSPEQSTSQSGYLSSSFYYSRSSDGVMKMKAPAKKGIYEIRFHGPKRKIFIKRLVFVVGDPSEEGLSYSLDKQIYQPGEKIKVTYVGNQDLFERTWMGTFLPTEGNYDQRLDHRFLENDMGGTLLFDAPTQEGMYQVKWFYADQGPQLLEPLAFEIKGSIADSDNMKTETLKEQLETEGKIVFYGIYFDFNKSTIRQESEAVIQQLAELLRSSTDLKVSINGHTDNVGTAHYNQKLSEARAAEVMRVLIEDHNVSASQLVSAGYGESKPVDTNETEEGKANNRRVEVVK